MLNGSFCLIDWCLHGYWRMFLLGSFQGTYFYLWIAILFKLLYLAQDWPSWVFIVSIKLPILLHREYHYTFRWTFAILDYLPSSLAEFIFNLVLCSHKGAVAVRQPYIRVVGIEEANEANSRGPAAFLPEEVSLESLWKLQLKLYWPLSSQQCSTSSFTVHCTLHCFYQHFYCVC